MEIGRRPAVGAFDGGKRRARPSLVHQGVPPGGRPVSAATTTPTPTTTPVFRPPVAQWFSVASPYTSRDCCALGDQCATFPCINPPELAQWCTKTIHFAHSILSSSASLCQAMPGSPFAPAMEPLADGSGMTGMTAVTSMTAMTITAMTGMTDRGTLPMLLRWLRFL